MPLFTPSGRNRTHAEVARMQEQVGFSAEAEEGGRRKKRETKEETQWAGWVGEIRRIR